MNKNPVNGMRDISINEMNLRIFLLSELKDIYKKFGFNEIRTPICESISNLISNEGWENEKLIFKIQKRGEKLKKVLSNNDIKEEDLVDMGLRYDLTLPLCRYYANNKKDLPMPFKSLQCDYVYRADRPQLGRYREFMQCDIDIIGESSNLAEIDLILATSTFLKKIGFNKYKFYYEINDRKILKAIQNKIGFSDSEFQNVCIIQDKYDKIGIQGVKEELLNSNFDNDLVLKYLDLLSDINKMNLEELKKLLLDTIDVNVIENLLDIIEITKEFNIDVKFNPNLVRGMGYYTDTIYEIKTDNFNSSIGGGGRYNDLIKKYLNESIPAIGISIGFERIVNILLNDNYKIPYIEKELYCVENTLDRNSKLKVFKNAMKERDNNKIINIIKNSKNKRFQREGYEKLGYNKFLDC